MRIASLVPSSTEMLFALGLGDQVVAVTHECDWPPAAASIPHLTRTVVPDGLSAAEIDRAVRETVAAGRPLYELDAERLAELDPELIVTQAVCDVCAVSYDDVVAVAATLPSKPRVISLDPMTLDEVLDDVRRLGDATEATAESQLLREQARRRIDAVQHAVADAVRPRVAAIEWLDPAFIAGHWVPEMIRLAGGQDVLGRSGERSRTAEWEEVAARGARRRDRHAVRLRRPALRRGGGALRGPARPARRPANRGGRRLGVLFAPRAAADRRDRAPGPPAAPRSSAGSGRSGPRGGRDDRCGRRDLNPHRQEPTSS